MSNKITMNVYSIRTNDNEHCLGVLEMETGDQ